MATISVGSSCGSVSGITTTPTTITASASPPSVVVNSGFCCEECKTPFIIADIHEGDECVYVYLDMPDGTIVQETSSGNTTTVYNGYAAIDLNNPVAGDKVTVAVNTPKCTSKSKVFTVKEKYEDCGCSTGASCDIRVRKVSIAGDQVNGYHIDAVDVLSSSPVQYRLNGGVWVSSVKDVPTFDGFDGNYLEIRGKHCPTRVVKMHIDSLDTEIKSPLLPTELLPKSPIISASTTQLESVGQLAILSGACEIGTIKWNNGSTAKTITVPAGTYSATCVNINGESEPSQEITISASASAQSLTSPTVTTNATSVFGTDKATLSGVCSVGDIVWSNGETASSINVGAGSYTARCVLGSASSPSSSPIVISTATTPPAIPTPPTISSNVTEVATGGLATLSGTCSIGNILWSTGATSSSILVGAGTYSATCVNSAGSSASSTPIVIGNQVTPALFSLIATNTCGELNLSLSYYAGSLDVEVRQFGSLNVVYSGSSWVTGDSVLLFGLQPSTYVVYYKPSGAAYSAYVSSVSTALSC